MKTSNNPHPATFFIVLISALYVAYCQTLPELFVKRTTRIIFPDEQLERFFQCLCDITSFTCTLWYSRNQSDVYVLLDTNQTQRTQIVQSSRNFKIYSCIITEDDLVLRGMSDCVRRQGYDDCVTGSNSFCRSCDLGYILIFWDFENNTIFHNWNEIADNSISTTTEHTIVDDVSTDKEDNFVFYVIIGILSAVVLILLVIVLVLVVMTRCKSKPKQLEEKSEGNLFLSPDINNLECSTSTQKNCELDSGTNDPSYFNHLNVSDNIICLDESIPIKHGGTDIPETTRHGGANLSEPTRDRERDLLEPVRGGGTDLLESIRHGGTDQPEPIKGGGMNLPGPIRHGGTHNPETNNKLPAKESSDLTGNDYVGCFVNDNSFTGQTLDANDNSSTGQSRDVSDIDVEDKNDKVPVVDTHGSSKESQSFGSNIQTYL